MRDKGAYGSKHLLKSVFVSCFYLVVHLEGSMPTKYGLLLNNDDRYKDVKRELSRYCGLVCSQLLLVEIFGASVKVTHYMEQWFYCQC